MPIIVKVKTELDDGGLDGVRRTAQTALDGMGRDLGGALEAGIKQSLSGALSGAVSELGSFGKVAESSLSGLVSGAGAAALGIGSIVVAAAAAGKALYDLGATWDSIGDSITMATGRTGEGVAELQRVVGDVGSMTAASLGDIGKVVEQLVQQFPNLDTAGESIRVLASDIATLNAAGQTVNIHDLGLAMRVFGVSAESGTKALDDFAAVSRATGTPISKVISEVRSGAPIFKQFGMDMGEAASYLAAFDAAGVSSSSTMTGLRAALVKLSGDGRGAREALQETIVEIKRLSDSGDDFQARQLAIETFGKRAFAPMLEAITSGTLELDKLNQALDGTTMSIQQMKEATEDGKEGWQELGNTMQTKFKPLADIIFSAINDGAQLLTGNLNKVQGGFRVAADSAADLRTELDKIVELQRQFQPDSPLGRMLLPAGVPGGPNQGGIQGPGGVGGSLGLGRDTGLGVNEGLGGFASVPKTGSGSGAGGDLTPYGPGYGQGPKPGESAEQYRARMDQLEADHRVAEAEANLDKLRSGGTATAEQLQKAENDLAEARTRQYETQLRGTKPGAIDVAIPYAPDFGNGPQPGETTQQYSARTALLEAQHRSAEEIAKLNQMESSGVATQNEIINQKNKVLEAQRAQQSAEMRLNDAYTKQVADATKGLDALGAGLDKDLGLSKGLAGLADNLVRFLGNLAAAPLMGQINAITAAQGGVGATGSGLIGMLGATGAFGPQYQVGGYDSSGKPISMAAMQSGGSYITPSAAVTSPRGGYPGDAALLASVPAGRYVNAEEYMSGRGANGESAKQIGDLTQGLADCSSSVEDLVNIMDGRPTGGREMATNNAAEWLASRGFLPTNAPVPGAFQVGFNPSHMQATLPGGTPFNWGSDPAAAKGGVGGSGAWDSSFTQHYYRPVGAVPGGPTGSTSGGPYAPLSPNQLTNPGLTNPTQSGLYDEGGFIMPGTTVVQNNTGSPEPVVNPQGMVGSTPATQIPSIMGPNIAGGPGGGGPAPGPGQQGPTQIGGAEKQSQNGGSVGGGGGLFGAGVGAASMAADAFAPGSGAAVQIAGAEIQRAIKFGGQLAGIGVSGLMETFLPTGASQLANDSWLTRIAGGFAGVGAQLPNLAGKAPTPVPQQQAAAPPPMPASNTHSGGGNQPGPGPQINVTYNNNGATEDRAGADLVTHLTQIPVMQGSR